MENAYGFFYEIDARRISSSFKKFSGKGHSKRISSPVLGCVKVKALA